MGSPNPAWYYLQVDAPGVIQLELSQTTGPWGIGTALDLTFAMWGPFVSVAQGCSLITAKTPAIQCSRYQPNQTPDNFSTEFLGIGAPGGDCASLRRGWQLGLTWYNYPAPPNNPTTCSTPPAAQAGEIYIVLLTNYSGQPGYMQLHQTNAGQPGSGTTDCSVLPIELTSFTARCEEASVRIQWTTATETDLSHYDVLRSWDGLNWDVAATVSAVGHSIMHTSYEVLDDRQMGITYYQLRSTDLDGSVELHGAVPVQCKASSSSWHLNAGPPNDAAYITMFSRMPYRDVLQIVDVSGRVVASHAIQVNEGSNTLLLPTGLLSTGMYFIRLAENTLGLEALKMVK